MQDIRQLRVHGTFNFGGKNFPETIVTKQISGLKLQWDPKEKWVEISYNDRHGKIFQGNCAVMEIEDGTEITVPVNEHHTQDIRKIGEAQVSTPHGYVFEGPGKGKTGQRTAKQ